MTSTIMINHSAILHILVIAFTLEIILVEECPVLALINTTEEYNNIGEAVQDIAFYYN